MRKLILTALMLTALSAWGQVVNPVAGAGSGTVTSVTFTGDGTVLSATPSSAVTTTGTVTATLVNTPTGTGSVVLATSPTLVTPALGTPASEVITNVTGTCTNCTANTAVNITCGPEWIMFPGTFAGSNVISVTTLNTTAIWSFEIPCSLTFNKITYIVSTVDNSANTYDIGIYSATGGTLVCHEGSTAGTTFTGASTGVKTATMTGNCVLVAGTRYVAAMTSSASAVAKLSGNGSGGLTAMTAQAPTGGGTSGGALNSSLTVPADNYTASVTPIWAFHN